MRIRVSLTGFSSSSVWNINSRGFSFSPPPSLHPLFPLPLSLSLFANPAWSRSGVQRNIPRANSGVLVSYVEIMYIHPCCSCSGLFHRVTTTRSLLSRFPSPLSFPVRPYCRSQRGLDNSAP